jgi:hypothetical protein
MRLTRKHTSEFFNGDFIETIGYLDVAWVDFMGMKDALRNDQDKPSVLRGELLATIHRYTKDAEVEGIFTIGDGVIILSESRDYLKEFLAALFNHYMKVNLTEYRDDVWLARLPRGGIGSGRVQQIDMETFEEENHSGNPIPESFDNTPFGPGTMNAMDAESSAPLGINEYNGGNITPYRWWSEHQLGQYGRKHRREFLEFFEEYQDWHRVRDEYRYSPDPPDESDHLQAARNFFISSSFDIPTVDTE